MKRKISLALALLLAASMLVLPVMAETTTFTWDLPHNTPIKHKGLMVMEHTVGVEIGASYETHESMTSQDIQDAIQAVLDDPEQQVIAEGQIGRIDDQLVRCRRIGSDQIVVPIIGHGSERGVTVSVVNEGETIDFKLFTFLDINHVIVENAT